MQKGPTPRLVEALCSALGGDGGGEYIRRRTRLAFAFFWFGFADVYEIKLGAVPTEAFAKTRFL